MAGTLHVPEGPAPLEWPAIALFLCSAIHNRSDNRAMKQAVSRKLNALGIPLLTFDFPGVGDSRGELREDWLAKVFRQIESGGFVLDTLDAVRFLQERFPSKRVILFGNCGGAITALHAAAKDRSITHLVITALPVTLSIAPGVDSFDSTLAKFQVGDYLKRLCNPGNWRKIISRRTNYAKIWSAVSSLIRSRLGRQTGSGEIVNGLSACFLSSFLQLKKRNVDVLCLYGEQDRVPYSQYRDLFLDRYAAAGEEPGKNWQTKLIPDASHDFYSPAARDRFQSALELFLREHGIKPPKPSREFHQEAFSTVNHSF
ncbi:MAG: alpha/beta hydrolase [Candidatus Latescibacterota bacterium]